MKIAGIPDISIDIQKLKGVWARYPKHPSIVYPGTLAISKSSLTYRSPSHVEQMFYEARYTLKNDSIIITKSRDIWPKNIKRNIKNDTPGSYLPDPGLIGRVILLKTDENDKITDFLLVKRDTEGDCYIFTGYTRISDDPQFILKIKKAPW